MAWEDVFDENKEEIPLKLAKSLAACSLGCNQELVRNASKLVTTWWTERTSTIRESQNQNQNQGQNVAAPPFKLLTRVTPQDVDTTNGPRTGGMITIGSPKVPAYNNTLMAMVNPINSIPIQLRSSSNSNNNHSNLPQEEGSN
ncbi:hypothetical protein BCR41DRAFT_397840 [Lobosporangium transversale]|uniref:Uncharacterized protein n=1 Tax=Lobosporangium transversale TaxID=64571 RepID=A0A1Y2GKJ8_9FUNG|nr:hypothetical protein BCR41DRAFT_397840 [Lobosporangium transversale]ORZ11687.1 hypothetical protein BCR41DRAFT_397840 [Lobosporangium transversale]|eukprot:XP_021879784.1 hypothetical protein BCR41DRAFT_397840 [Lobosporangium transversale]